MESSSEQPICVQSIGRSRLQEDPLRSRPDITRAGTSDRIAVICLQLALSAPGDTRPLAPTPGVDLL
jgi:hypothetical protein